MNSFLMLQAQELAAFDEPRRTVVRRRVERDLRTAELVGDLVELFVPVLADTLNVLGGGEPILETPDAPEQ